MRYGDGVAGTDAPDTLWADYHAVYHLADGADSSPSGFDGQVMGAVAVEGFIGPGARLSPGPASTSISAWSARFSALRPAATATAWARIEPGWDASGVVFATSIDNMGMPTNTSRLQMIVQIDRTPAGQAPEPGQRPERRGDRAAS